jgi:hypothetical protein
MRQKWTSLPSEFLNNIPILVEESCSERNSLHDELQVLDALALLLESHRTTVIDVDDNIVESKPRFVSRVSRISSAMEEIYLTISTAISLGMCHA